MVPGLIRYTTDNGVVAIEIIHKVQYRNQRIEEKAGHGAGKPTSKRIEETADVYSFTMYNLGMEY